jgi:glutamine synthetase adenylyltransferase
MQSMNEAQGEVQSNPVQIDNNVENSAVENENFQEENLGLSEHASGDIPEESGKESDEDLRKKLRKIEKDLRKKNTQLTNQLYETQEQLKSYSQLFETTYGNAQKDSNNQQPKDEVEEKVKAIINRAEQDANLKRMQQANQELLNELGENINSSAEKYDDFDESFSEFANSIPGQQREEFLNIIKFMPNAGDVVYSLSKNPTELKRILSLNPLARAKSLAQHMIDVAVNSSNNRVVSNAPKPLNGGNLRGNPSMTPDLITMSYADLKASLKNKPKKR